MLGPAKSYEIRLRARSGRLSILMQALAVSDADAKQLALRMLGPGMSEASLWCGDDRIARLHRIGA
jgi:hypothetical protein